MKVTAGDNLSWEDNIPDDGINSEEYRIYLAKAEKTLEKHIELLHYKYDVYKRIYYFSTVFFVFMIMLIITNEDAGFKILYSFVALFSFVFIINFYKESKKILNDIYENYSPKVYDIREKYDYANKHKNKEKIYEVGYLTSKKLYE